MNRFWIWLVFAGVGANVQAQLFGPESLAGAALGGLAGAVIGHNSGRHGGEGAAIGAGVGAVLGAIVGDERRREAASERLPVEAVARPNYAISGAVVGGVAGAVIGHNSGRHAGEGAAIGAGAGLLLGLAAEHSARQSSVRIYPSAGPAYASAVPQTVSNMESPAIEPAPIIRDSLVSNRGITPVTASMSGANALFGR